MSITFDYASVPLLSLDELLGTLSRAKEKYNCPADAEVDRMLFAEFHPRKLPSVLEWERGGDTTDINIKGYLPLKEDPLPTFALVFEGVHGRLADLLTYTNVSIGFEEKGSTQTRSRHDTIGISYRERKLLLNFSVYCSRASREIGYRRDLFSSLIEVAALPLSIEDSGDHFRLTHRFGGHFWISGCFPPDLSPSCFHCELPEDSIAEALDRAQRALLHIAGPKRFEYTWSVGLLNEKPGHPHPHPHFAEAYRILLEKAFPAERNYVNPTLIVKRIENVEAIRALCGPKDSALLPLCGFQHPDDPEEYVNLKVETTARGHRLLVEASMPLDVKKLSSDLGVELHER